MKLYHLDLIAAARPNFMKVAPLYHALAATDWCRVRLIHTGQHYDTNMSQSFFDDLQLPAPDRDLGVGSGTHAQQTASVLTAYEQACIEHRPDWVIVAGDVNSTLACALVASKLQIPVAHLEAGLRSRDRSMPEEINRVLTDAIADLLWTPSVDGDRNLIAEGVAADKIDCIGNIMIDAFEMLRPRIEASTIRSRLSVSDAAFGIVTLHRPSNVDNAAVLTSIVTQLGLASRQIPLIFAVHPRTRNRLDRFELRETLATFPGITLVEPLGYIDFMSLVTAAALVVTDSGGIQEETTYLGVPCLTVRDNTERPVTISQGTNRLVRPDRISDELSAVQAGDWQRGTVPDKWDGHTAARAVASLHRRLFG